MKKISSILMALLLVACAEEQPPQNQITADSILHNGKVYSFSWGDPDAEGVPASDAPYSNGTWSPDGEAIAIKDGNILAIGSMAEMSAYQGENTQMIDAKGGHVYPGFVDAHSHIRGLIANEKYVSITGAANEDEAIQMIIEATKDRELAPGEWILGGGWDEGEWMNILPTEKRLSELFPDNPVLMGGETGFGVWGNRAALVAAGFDRNTEDPDKGTFTRYEDGELSGVALDEAGRIWRRTLPPETVEERKDTLHKAMNVMASDGFTMTHDAGTASLSMAAFESLDAEKNMPIRIYAMVDRADSKLVDEWTAKGPKTFPGNMLFVRSMKSGLDGTLGVRSARFLEPYSDAPEHSGLDENWTKQIGQMDQMIQAGFQINTHAIGDKANREILEFLERNYAINPELRNLRHRSEHASVVHPDDYPRWVELNVIASAQPPYVSEDPPWALSRIGEERAKDMYAWRKMRRYGIRLAFGSDLSSYDHNIFYGIYGAITRANKEGYPVEGFLPEEKLTAEEAVRGYTNWAAYSAHVENNVGQLKPGMWADIAVVDKDILNVGTTNPSDLLNGEVMMTLVNGKVVFERD
ncbi:amidohydrolase [Pseudemcibacter aquimaris]|uniref:amidohydrolase n=1 Tax=Pseudemcibacter aquimaris TaxID=2857064 RepID=UPI00201141F8|nr:amidohydrolase [Pseudemcibacter aquimaris]MCC3862493.1 amidohydrolase [Pseudemcibacter aquimaris]WDU57755.1 amidohydrolase [Pseudemcibacter aquimaris]